ncbi:MAG TPA: NAD(P)-dependent oxidoreductase [Gemmatimonadales bacterium]|nr:NAD(P)-dependent oxidoreductase [Gemmatimonadales bacterium]
MTAPQVGFAGLGAIGWPMAARLAAAGPVVVWNRTGGRAAEFAAAHPTATVVETPRELAAAVPVVITCLSTTADVEAVLDGPDGLLGGLAPGSLLVDCTSGTPAGSRRIAERLAAHDVAFADAPVSGGTNGAEAGNLIVMVGCEPALLSRVEAAVAPFAGRVVRMGTVGAGDAMKAVNNALLAVNILAVAEGVAALVKAGVEPRLALDVLNVSSGRSFVSETLVPERVLTGCWPLTFRLALLHKDVGIATDLLRDEGVDGPVLDAVRERLQEAREVLGDSADYLEAIRMVEQQAGVEIRG